jgi:hypothetical protein
VARPAVRHSIQVCPRTDQRGVPGPLSGHSDCTIGAVEDLAGEAPTFNSGSTTPTYTLGAASQQGWPDAVTVLAIPSGTLSESGTLPAGVQFSAAAGPGTFDQTGTFSSTPTHTGVYPVTLSEGNYLLPNLGTPVAVTVNQKTSTSLALAKGTAEVGQAVTYVASVSSEVALSGGSMAFSDSLGAIANCGSQPLSASSSTVATATCTTHAFEQAGSDQVRASFSGDTEDLASAASQATTVAPAASITASLSSSKHESKSGWWLAPVTVSFTCVSGAGSLVGTCPGPVKLSKSGRDQAVSKTITTSTGETESVSVKANIGLTHLKVEITGVKAGHTYATAPHARCHALDRVSGIESCRLTRRTSRAAGGEVVRYTARASSKSGLTARARIAVKVSG